MRALFLLAPLFVATAAVAQAPTAVTDGETLEGVALPDGVAVFGTADQADAPPLVTSEDCLYLNVWSAGVGGRDRRPVMEGIHSRS